MPLRLTRPNRFYHRNERRQPKDRLARYAAWAARLASSQLVARLCDWRLSLRPCPHRCFIFGASASRLCDIKWWVHFHRSVRHSRWLDCRRRRGMDVRSALVSESRISPLRSWLGDCEPSTYTDRSRRAACCDYKRKRQHSIGRTLSRQHCAVWRELYV